MKRAELTFEIFVTAKNCVLETGLLERRASQSPLERGITEGENPVLETRSALVRRPFDESRCLGVQRKAGGTRLPKLDTSERPIVDKYREGKMRSTWRRECKRA